MVEREKSVASRAWSRSARSRRFLDCVVMGTSRVTCSVAFSFVFFSLYLALLALVLELALLAASFFSSPPGSPSVRGGGTTMGRWGMATPSSISDVDDDEELVIKSLPEWVRRKLRGALSHQ